MTLDRQLAEVLAAAEPAEDLLAMPHAAAQEAFHRKWMRWNTLAPRMAELREIRAGEAGPTCLYHRPTETARGLIVFVHGGGWTFGSPQSHLVVSASLALAANAHLLSVDYRLCPAHPFPASLDDVLAALAAAERGALPHDAVGCGVAAAGDSAGAALALGAVQTRIAEGGPVPAAAALFYGCFAPVFDTPSYRSFGDGTFGLSGPRMRTFWEHHLGHPPAGAEGVATPGLAPVENLPPTYLHAAGHDVLRDDSLALATRIAEAGGEVRLDVSAGLNHGHLHYAPKVAASARVIREAGAFLRHHLDAAAEG